MDDYRATARALILAASFLAIASCATRSDGDLARIENIVVIYAENRSFDHLYGLFPGADGLAQATAEQKTQVDHDGKPLPSLPATYDPVRKGQLREDLPSRGLPNGPFRIDAPPSERRWSELLPNPIHAYFQNREQIAGGKNNKFVALTNVGAWTMGYFDGSQMRLWQWAKEYTLADHFLMGAFGGSNLTHIWLLCACTPRDPGAPAATRPQLDEHGYLRRRPTSPASLTQGVAQLLDGSVTADGYSVNTTQAPYQPSGVPPAADGNLELADPGRHTLPPMREKSIGDTLSAKGVSWAWYAGGWNAATADGRREPSEPRQFIYSAKGQAFQPHHQPFNYFARFAPGTPDRAQHLKDGDEVLRAIDGGTLPPVSFYKPAGVNTQPPSYTDIMTGDEHISALLERLRRTPQWHDMMV